MHPTGKLPVLLPDPDWRPQHLDVTLRNVGNSVSVLKRAELKILDFEFLETCEEVGGQALNLTAAYDVTLPTRPRIGQTIQSKVSQQIRPNEADRFLLRLNVSELNLVSASITTPAKTHSTSARQLSHCPTCPQHRFPGLQRAGLPRRRTQPAKYAMAVLRGKRG